MADDITLTVRVRDLTRGDFDKVRQRMRGMDGDIRRVAHSSQEASDRADRMSQSIRGVSGRMQQLQRTGSLARSEMDHMRQSLRLLGRDLNMAGRSGEMTEDEFRSLSDQLQRTRLDFDHLDNDLRRHDAVAQRRHRDAMARQREADRQRREELRREMDATNRVMAQRRRVDRAHSAALREEMTRNRRAEAERQRAAAAAATAQRQGVGRLAGMGGDDQGLTLRFRALGENDMNRMTRGFARLQGAMAGVSGSSARARRTVRALDGDLRTMARALQEAGDAGSLSRRDFNALSNGLRTTIRDAHLLQRSGDLTRSSFRDMRSEVTRLQAQLRLLGREGNVFNRLSDGTLLLQRRLRDTRTHAGVVRRSLSRLGEGGLGGLRLFTHSLGRLGNGLGRVREMVSNASRGMKMFLLILGLIGPLAAPVGALLTTILGGAFVALGAFALRSEKDVRRAFNHMKSTIGVTVRAAAQPLRGALVVAMTEVTVAVQEMGKALSAAFSATAPLVSDLVGGFTDLAAKAMPGFVSSLRDMGPVIEGFRDAMGMIGEGIGDMFAAMTSGGGAEGLGESWKVVGDGIRDVLINIGQFINSMSQSETATALLKTAFGALSGILILIEGAFKAVDAVLGPVIEKMNELGLTGGALGVLSTILEGLGVSSSEVKTGLVDLKGAQDDAATATLSHADALKRLNEQLRTYNQENLSRFDAEASLNQAFQDATRNAENYGKTVKINNGIFDTTHENTRKVYQDFSKLAENTTRAVEAAEKAKQPLSEQNRLWKQGEANIRALGEAYNIPKAELDAFIALVLKTPKAAKTEMKLEAEAAQQKAADLLTKLGKVNGFRAKALTALEAGAAIAKAGQLAAMLNALDGRTTRSRSILERITTDVHRRVEEGASKNFTSANGNVFRNFANGGMEKHVAQIAPAGAMRIWAERETGGESYIPLSPAKRARSRRIAEQTIGILGGRAEWFAKGGVVSEAKQARGPIKAATSGTTEKNLLRLMNSIIKHTIKMATALKQVNSALEKAKSKLSSLKSESSSLSSSVKSGVLSATNVTSGVESGKHVTVASIMGGLTAGRDKSKAFASALSRLRKKGLNKTLLRQIAEAGIGGGGLETAGALLTASGSEFRSVNSLQSQISKSASSAGKTTASALYSKQIKTQEKLVKSLDELSKALKKATAKRKKKAVGGPIGAASGGARGGLTWVGEEGPELVRLPYGASVSSNSDSRRIAGLDRGPGSSSGGPSVINVYIGEKKVDEIILDSNRRTVRTRGGNVQAAFGRKNG